MSSDSFIYSFTNVSRPNHCLNLTKIGLKRKVSFFSSSSMYFRRLNLTKIGLKLSCNHKTGCTVCLKRFQEYVFLVKVIKIFMKCSKNYR